MAAASTAYSDKSTQVARILIRWVVTVVVSYRAAGVECVDQRHVYLPAVRLACGGTVLTCAVQEIPHDLVGDE
jgi:hypothetical protein